MSLPPSPTTEEDINKCVHALETSIQMTADAILKKPKFRVGTVPWWSTKLTALRNTTHEARRDF